MSTRALQILSRFPAHLDAARPGKQLSFVTEQLALGLDLLAADLAEVRRAHRLAHADTVRDLVLLGALHGIGGADIDVLRRKKTRLLQLCDQLDQAVASKTAAARDTTAELLCDLFAVDAPPPRLPLFVPPPRTDLDAAAATLSQLVRASVGFHGYLEALRARTATICRIHHDGNATVRAIIAGAANALDLDVDEAKNRAVRAVLLKDPAAESEMDTGIDDGLFHSKDLFWHSTFVKDRMALPPPLADKKTLPLLNEVLGIEENPLRREYWPLPTGTPPAPVPEPMTHGELFHIQRRGFGRELLQINVTGVGDKTVGPMIVNRDEGRGIGWFGRVPDGKVLQLTEDGRALLDGADVTANVYSWQGACFALPAGGEPSDDTLAPPHDFVFDGPLLDRHTKKRVATFAVALPAGALDREAAFPHAGDNVEAPGIGIGRTRLAFFVQEAHLSGDLVVTPHPLIGFAGDANDPTARASVFAMPWSSPPPPALPLYHPPPTAAKVSLSWREHEAYAVRVLIPSRFAKLDGAKSDGAGAPVTERVRLALERFRAAGVDVRVEYIDDRWVLGNGFLVGSGAVDPNMELRGGTVLFTTPPSP